MRLYRGLARVFPRSFSAKLMTVVFIGVHVPLLGLLLWMAVSGHYQRDTMWTVVGVVLGATLVGTAMAMMALYRLMAPLRQAADALEAYYDEQRLPHLPDLGHDEIGRLLRSINRNLHGVDAGLRDLRRSVLLDPLTQALNRRGCEQALADSAQLAQSRRQPLSLFVVDLDNLKPINDAHGHLAGDQVLVRLVESARQWLQPGDWIGRWGGDEFVLAVHASHAVACVRLRHWLAVLAADNGEQTPLKASAGGAAYRPGEDLREVYRRADAAMYRAKYAGGARLLCEPD
ncbi:GGDEF domain-containing protein [Stenotrophomonas rhizophila]|jgi:diguanylate cyclase (GGDEF)-like protein|uniref:GGDEF domain-containing protein n=1 Tax=Stenotrophomonas rhizophila TaxID=216778 RepID=UPI000456B2A8|nr:GGDEF domain-containing protein [Stenotrophomonas rhizophila]AHY57661.1 diguanylate cyclase [Stenotrophomonas rhizophila]